MFGNLLSSRRLELKTKSTYINDCSCDCEIIKIGDYFIVHNGITLNVLGKSNHISVGYYAEISNYMDKYLRIIEGLTIYDYELPSLRLASQYYYGVYVPSLTTKNGEIQAFTNWTTKRHQIWKGGSIQLKGTHNKISLVDDDTRIGVLFVDGSIGIYDPPQNRFANIMHSKKVVDNFDFCKQSNVLSLDTGTEVSLWDIRYDRYPFFVEPVNHRKYVWLHNDMFCVGHMELFHFYSHTDLEYPIRHETRSDCKSRLIWDRNNMNEFLFSDVNIIEHIVYDFV